LIRYLLVSIAHFYRYARGAKCGEALSTDAPIGIFNAHYYFADARRHDGFGTRSRSTPVVAWFEGDVERGSSR
jgi:hypothetical protein